MTIDQIANIVADTLFIRLEDMLNDRHLFYQTEARQIAMLFAYEYAEGATYEKIASYFRRNNHTTVIAAIKRVEQLLSAGDTHTIKKFDAVKEKVLLNLNTENHATGSH